jgi:carboxyl-terminal processing protease
VPAGKTEQQQDLLQDLWAHVEQTYVDPLFNGIDWDAVHDEYAGYVAAGLMDAEFAAAMSAMLLELGDQHSHYQSAQEVAEEAARLAEGVDYVGIGVFGVIIPESGAATLVAVFPGSPAALAGLRPHDVILSVNGKAPIEPNGTNNLRGPAGTIASLSVQRPGGQPFAISLVRAPVAGSIPVDYCLVKGTKVGYIMIPTLLDATIGDQVGEALQEMARAGTLSGIILDNRMDGGGLGSEAREVLSYFIDGPQGGLVSRTGSDPFIIDGQNVGGSQSAQLIVLVDRDTASYGEVTSGILQHAGRATVVGRTTDGNVEILTGHDLEDGSRAWVATYTFEPIGLPAGIWEDTGIVVDVAAPTRWDLFTDANDPAMEKALAVLGVH